MTLIFWAVIGGIALLVWGHEGTPQWVKNVVGGVFIVMGGIVVLALATAGSP
jgi:hypothetical protein